MTGAAIPSAVCCKICERAGGYTGCAKLLTGLAVCTGRASNGSI